MVTVGTPIPNSMIEAKSQGSSAVKRYFLSPDDLEEYQRKYPTIKRGNDQMLKLTKEQYLNERKAGKSRNQIVKDQKISPPVLYKALEAWGVKEQSAEQEALAALNQASVVEAPSAVEKQTDPVVIVAVVKLPRSVAEAIRNARDLGFPNVEIIEKSFAVADYGPYRNAIRDFAADNFDLFLQALVNGYEVEESKEDKVRKVLLEYCNGSPVSNWVIEAIQQIYDEGVTGRAS